MQQPFSFELCEYFSYLHNGMTTACLKQLSISYEQPSFKEIIQNNLNYFL